MFLRNLDVVKPERFFAESWIQFLGTRISQLLRTAHAELSRLCATIVAREATADMLEYFLSSSCPIVLPDSCKMWPSVQDRNAKGNINQFLSCFWPMRPQHDLPERTQNQLHPKRLSTHRSFGGNAHSVWSSATLARRVAFEYIPRACFVTNGLKKLNVVKPERQLLHNLGCKLWARVSLDSCVQPMQSWVVFVPPVLQGRPTADMLEYFLSSSCPIVLPDSCKM